MGFCSPHFDDGPVQRLIDVRDGFTKAVQKGEIVAVVGASESLGMILTGQLPPQFVVYLIKFLQSSFNASAYTY
ncbi:MAG: hypothetical protein CM1200mP41_10290 [Gammaproteobacteria bacterium]|nr:MAG: hypothetical protein CM1200mP41_10290 [Gammaproteobacteria bacterium]